MANLFNFIFWLLILVFISWWLAFFCFFPYVIVSIIVPCIPALKPLMDLLLACCTFPFKCSDNMINQRPYNAI